MKSEMIILESMEKEEERSNRPVSRIYVPEANRVHVPQRDIHEPSSVMNCYSQTELKEHLCNMLSKDSSFVNHIHCTGSVVTVEMQVRFL